MIIKSSIKCENNPMVIINICFLPKKSNQIIGYKNPSEYFVDKVKESNIHYEEDLEHHLIPYHKDSGIWNNTFKKFLIERTGLINEKIKELTNID